MALLSPSCVGRLCRASESGYQFAHGKRALIPNLPRPAEIVEITRVVVIVPTQVKPGRPDKARTELTSKVVARTRIAVKAPWVSWALTAATGQKAIDNVITAGSSDDQKILWLRHPSVIYVVRVVDIDLSDENSHPLPP
jgi:hypothetical protein